MSPFASVFADVYDKRAKQSGGYRKLNIYLAKKTYFINVIKRIK